MTRIREVRAPVFGDREFLLVDAASSYGRDSEDRLTEIMATALASHPGFSGAIFRRLGLPAGDRRAVATQQLVTTACRPDLFLYAYDKGRVVAQIWIENKHVDYDFHDRQLENQREAFDQVPGETKRLIAVLPADSPHLRKPDQPPSVTLRQRLARITPAAAGRNPAYLADRLFSWQDIANLAYEVGNAQPDPWGGGRWRVEAMRADAPACQRLLHEFITYLEQQMEVVVEPLNSDNIVAFKLREQTLDRLDEIIERAFGRLRQADFSANWDAEELTASFGSPASHWLRRRGGELEFIVDERDSFSPDETGEPAFGAGFSLPARLYEAVSADRQWVEEATAADFGLKPDGKRLCCYRKLSLATLVKGGGTLDEQADFLARWALDALATARDLKQPRL